MNFLIQTIGKKIKHDFSFALIQSCEFNNWFRNNREFKYFLTEECVRPNVKKEYIPIGSVEFVSEYLQKYYGLTPKPKNVPVELMGREWSGRTILNGTEKDIIGEKFVKSNDKTKSFTEICESAPEGNYQISDLIDIKSEWRAFIYKKGLVGLQNYSGDFCTFPDVDKIKGMIESYIHQPIAYTLDVAVTNENNTVIIEVHDFFSCGLYGFSEHKILPYMFSNWFYYYIYNKSKNGKNS